MPISKKQPAHDIPPEVLALDAELKRLRREWGPRKFHAEEQRVRELWFRETKRSRKDYASSSHARHMLRVLGAGTPEATLSGLVYVQILAGESALEKLRQQDRARGKKAPAKKLAA